jgi:hypothetical protein
LGIYNSTENAAYGGGHCMPTSLRIAFATFSSCYARASVDNLCVPSCWSCLFGDRFNSFPADVICRRHNHWLGDRPCIRAALLAHPQQVSLARVFDRKMFRASKGANGNGGKPCCSVADFMNVWCNPQLELGVGGARLLPVSPRGGAVRHGRNGGVCGVPGEQQLQAHPGRAAVPSEPYLAAASQRRGRRREVGQARPSGMGFGQVISQPA